MKACGNPECAVSSDIVECLTFGSGELSDNGTWEFPCKICEDQFYKDLPKTRQEVKQNQMSRGVSEQEADEYIRNAIWLQPLLK